MDNATRGLEVDGGRRKPVRYALWPAHLDSDLRLEYVFDMMCMSAFFPLIWTAPKLLQRIRAIRSKRLR